MTEAQDNTPKLVFIQKIKSFLMEKTKTPCLPLKCVPQKTGPFDSKIGGEPYLPPGFAYPTVNPSAVQSNPSKQQKKNIGGDGATPSPLKLLAQLNFDTLPRVPDFPTTGILQIYIDPADGSLGHDYENMMDQSHWRIIYHPTIEHDEAKLQKPPHFPETEELPFEEEHLIAPETLIEAAINPFDYRYDSLVEEAFSEEASELGLDITEIIGEFYEQALNALDTTNNHQIGGYPSFAQEDPRHNTQYQDCDTLLLQINSDEKIMWGDMGIANFFIRRDDLKACRFDRVLYNWDCS
ncbi:putative protein of unknown function (DUF1963) [Blattamonas nauphoetae]|uniref:DUF1963 domain-containing protein n=1 Tax=Blattamonas nauphoetae TaxID=2049346 RepID=A0ABQ9XI44_9EUKA|nr:putative protein of unknown function (DUF1963) [Blattamonas nauphoetae]